MSGNVQAAYNKWANSYDYVANKTRDLDKAASQNMLSELMADCPFVLEVGCGTGKNTEWLSKIAERLTSIDFSEEMLNKARKKFTSSTIEFRQVDITKEWPFENQSFHLLTCNLILEHIENLDFVFREAARVLKQNSYFFVSELHPAKQYLGSKAHFEDDNKIISPDCYVHHISDFFLSATNNGFRCLQLKEWFDEDDRTSIPRLICFLFQKDF